MKENYSLSVIICVYNGEKTIETTLKSLLQQHLKDFEVVIVNDASLDNTESLVKEFFNKHQHIKYNYIKNDTNKGLFFSRFKGVLNSKGEYITFLDADDTLCSNMYTSLISNVKANNSDIVLCAVNRVKSGKVVTSILFSEPDMVEFKQNPINVMLQKATYNSGFIWMYNKIIKKDLFITIYTNSVYKNNVYINMGEDVLLSIYLYYYAKQITFVNQPLYNYHINLFSMVNLRKKSINNTINTVTSLGEVIKYTKLFLQEKNIFANNEEYYNNYLQHEASSLTLKQVTLTEIKLGLVDKYINAYVNAFGFYPSINKLLTKLIKRSIIFKTLTIVLFMALVIITVMFYFN